MNNINFEMLFNNWKRIFVFITIIFFSLIFSKEVFTQNISLSELTPHKYAPENLKIAISSDNCGIKRSAIYLIGKYKIAEGENLLEEMFNSEKDPCNKILAALVLMELNKTKGIIALKKLTKTELNEETKKMALFTYYEHLINDADLKKD